MSAAGWGRTCRGGGELPAALVNIFELALTCRLSAILRPLSSHFFKYLKFSAFAHFLARRAALAPRHAIFVKTFHLSARRANTGEAPHGENEDGGDHEMIKGGVSRMYFFFCSGFFFIKNKNPCRT